MLYKLRTYKKLQRDEVKEKDVKAVPLGIAISKELPCELCYVYKITVGGKEYIGFTTQIPEDRLEQHLAAANEGSKQKVHIALRRFGNLHKFEILSEHFTEVEGLVAEISAIEKNKPELNSSIGGEGNNYRVVLGQNDFGEEIFYVSEKEKKKEADKEDLIAEQVAHISIENMKISFTEELIERFKGYDPKIAQKFELNIEGKTFAEVKRISERFVREYCEDKLQKYPDLIPLAIRSSGKYDDFLFDLINKQGITTGLEVSSNDLLRELAKIHTEFAKRYYHQFGFQLHLPKGVLSAEQERNIRKEEDSRVKRENRRIKEQQKLKKNELVNSKKNQKHGDKIKDTAYQSLAGVMWLFFFALFVVAMFQIF